MQIGNVSFGSLWGRTEITNSYGSMTKSKCVTQYIHPFKDENVSETDKQAVMEFLKQGENNDSADYFQYDVKVGEMLPFTEDEFLKTKQLPMSKETENPVLDFLESDNYKTTVIKDRGFVADNLVKNGQVIEV